MKATAVQMAGLALGLSAGVAMAQAPFGPSPYGWGPDVGGPGYPGGPRGPAARVWLDVVTQSERGVFLVAIRYAGIAPDELKITPQDDELRIHVERTTQQQGPHGRMFAGSHVSRRVVRLLPPWAYHDGGAASPHRASPGAFGSCAGSSRTRS